MGNIGMRFLTLLLVIITLASVGGVYATWNYAILPPQTGKIDILISANEFDYTPDMPEGEATLLQRLYELLNNQYSNDIIPEGQSMNYLLSTLDKDWDTGLNPAVGSFVGSMDKTEESQYRLNAMFSDVIDLEHISFILKSEDLVGSVENEISIYSTSDPLTWTPGGWMNCVVGVYLSVFVPIVDETGVTVGYEQLCDSIHGYCLEVQYTDGDNTPSFSTDHWRDELFYWHEKYIDPQPITGEDRYKYECYHTADGNYAYPGRTASWLGWIIVPTNQWEIGEFSGKKAWQRLEEILASKS